MGAKRLYIVRHGQTQFNAEQRLQGQCNSDLTVLGQKQAQAIGRSLAQKVNLNEWPVICSPLGRAVETARWITAELGGSPESIRTDKRLMEFSLGDWEAKAAPEIKAMHPEFAERRDWYLEAPNAESLQAVKQRLHHWLDDAEIPEQVIVISHALTGSVLRGILTCLPDSDIFLQPRPQDGYFYVDEGVISQFDCL
ncbi:MAG: phosphoglycerate mutase GpmB [Candidatus Celerinatantimonas neptuna]|nr:MAG: phosphoglycerate mutase GpmB [Candidatus Celerinatantimonas neptuna]